MVNPQHTLRLSDVSVRLAGPPAIDHQTYRRTGAIVYTVPMQVNNGTDRPQRFPIPYVRGQQGQLVLQVGSHLYVEQLLAAVSPGQLLLLITGFADAGKTNTAERLGVIRFYK